MASAPPLEERDRFIDLLRVVCIVAVVLGHWATTTVVWEPDRVLSVNALSVVPWTRLATWLIQVMPLVFFAGGFANSVSRRRAGSYLTYLDGRLGRLLIPTGCLPGGVAGPGPGGRRASTPGRRARRGPPRWSAFPSGSWASTWWRWPWPRPWSGCTAASACGWRRSWPGRWGSSTSSPSAWESKASEGPTTPSNGCSLTSSASPMPTGPCRAGAGAGRSSWLPPGWRGWCCSPRWAATRSVWWECRARTAPTPSLPAWRWLP